MSKNVNFQLSLSKEKEPTKFKFFLEASKSPPKKYHKPNKHFNKTKTELANSKSSEKNKKVYLI
jgi:hypothetical protein